MRAPVRFFASTIRRWNRWEKIIGKPGFERPLRPPVGLLESQHAIRRRFKLAWGVFTGRYDALDWTSDEIGMKRRTAEAKAAMTISVGALLKKGQGDGAAQV